MKRNFIELKRKIKQRRIKIAVVGLGYVGLPLACEFAKKGFSVFGIDVDKDRLHSLKIKKSYITDLSNQRLKQVIESRKFNFSSDFRILKNIDAVLVCVPTPLRGRYQPDISYLISAVKSIAKNIHPGSLVILESTTYPGTTEEVILPIFKRNGLRPPEGIYLCFSPERIDPGNRMYSLSSISKIVGGINQESVKLGYLIYKTIIKKVLPVSSARVAETTKLLENTFRLVNIGLIDEMAMMAHKMGIDIWEVIQAAKTKPFGFMPFYPSMGVGGHCIPKDPLYLFWKARHFGFHSRFIKLASQVTSFMPAYIIQRLEEILTACNKSLKRSKILILGVTYKKNVKDLRKSPAIDFINLLQKQNIKVYYYDPIIPYLRLRHINLKSIKLNKNSLNKFDCVVIATDHSDVDYNFILRNSSFIFDTRNVYAKVRNKKIIRL